MFIRSAHVETDLPAVTSIINEFETQPVTVEEVHSWFAYSAPERVAVRLVSVGTDGLSFEDVVTGYGYIYHDANAPLGHFSVWVGAALSFRGQGIGAALWYAVKEQLRAHSATKLTSEVLDSEPSSLAFAERRGFTISRRLFHSALDLETFDETPYLDHIRALEMEGIRFCALADFPDTPETRRNLFELNLANSLDIPGVDHVPWDFDSFEKFVLNAPWFHRKGQLLAVDGETWVGLAAVSLDPDTRNAYNLHTGVARAYRGRKIAQALKVMAGRYARQHGMRTITTDNDSDNAPILAINRKMGYQPQPGKYQLTADFA